MPLHAGEKLGPYEILSPIGAGGMGEVYKARDTRLDRSVAIKVLPAHVKSQPDARQRFEREARAVSALNHPHICNLFDVGHQDGVDYIVMEHLEGESLEATLNRGPLPVREALRLGVQIAEALGQAHAQGVVHRDLKPGNVMVTRSGAKLLDFGLAKLQAAAQPDSDATQAADPTRGLTTAGTVLGTFQYMPPEQLEGKEADARSDIFSFGAVLYEMLTGRKAFRAGSRASLIAAVMSQDPPSPSTIQAGLPSGLDRIILRCLAKHPDERWQSARDLADELRWISGTSSQSGAAAVAAPGRRWAGRGALAAAVAGWALLAAALVPAVRHWTERPAKPLPVRFKLPPPADSGFPVWAVPAISPDGSAILFSTTAQGGPDRLWLRTLNSPEARPLPGTEGGYTPFWSPDGRKIGFSVASKLVTMELAGGAPVEIFSGQSGANRAAWGASGDILFVHGARLWRVSAAGGKASPLGELAAGETAQSWPEFLPGGRKFLYQSIRPNGSAIVAGSLDSNERKEILRADGNARFAPPGHLVFSLSGRLMAQPFDPESLALTGEAFPVPVAGSVATLGLLPGSALSAGGNGTLIWKTTSAGGARRLVWVDRSGKRLSTLGDPADYTNPALSPDGRRLAVGRRDPATKMRDIWVFDLVRGTNSRLTFDPADDLNPLWSRDGTRIAFTSDRKGERDIYWKNADGSGQDELLFEAKGGQKNIESWSADGRFIVYNFQPRPKPTQVWALPLTGDRKPVPLFEMPYTTQFAQVSPDNRWLAYTSNETGRGEVYMTAFSPGAAGGGKWQISSEGGVQPFWRADGRELFYMRGGTLMAVDVQHSGKSFEAGIPRELFEVTPVAEGRNRYVPSPDGQRFLMVMPAEDESRTPFEVLVNWTSLLPR